MKKYYLIVIFSILVFKITIAQWEIEESGTKADLRSVFFVDSTHGWAVGDSGIILKYDGEKWIRQNNNDSSRLFSVYFNNKDTGYAVGDRGTILITTDGGYKWQKQISGITSSLQSIKFCNKTTGYIVGDSATILKTTNAGKNWIFINKNDTNIYERFFSVYFIDSVIGFISSCKNILKTTDGGDNWIKVYNNTDCNFIYSLFFINKEKGYAINKGKGILLSTQDGGDTWTDTTYIPDNPHSIYFTNDTTLYVVGSIMVSPYPAPPRSLLLKSTNSGRTWISQYNVIYFGGLMSVFFIDNNNGWTVGRWGIILHTTNGGEIVGINELGIRNEELGIKVYPNPVSEKLNVEFSMLNKGTVEIRFYDLMGREVKTILNKVQNIGEYRINIDAQQLENGIYFLKLSNNNGTYITKFIKSSKY